MNKWKSPVFIFMTIFIFIWFSLVGEFGYAQSHDKSPLLKARMLAEQGDYNGALKILNEYIEKIQGKKSEKQFLNEARYLVAKIYFMVGEDDLCQKNLKNIYINNPEFKVEEADFAFKAKVEEIKNRILLEIDVEEKEKEEETKAEITEEKSDLQAAESMAEIKTEPKQEKKAVPQLKDKTKQEVDTKSAMTAAYKVDKTEKSEKKEEISEKQPEANAKEEKIDTEKQVKVKDQKTTTEKRVISKTTKEKSKKKFPWLLAIGGVVVAGVILYLLFKPKDDSVSDGGNNGIIPNYDTSVLGIQWINIPAGEFLMGDNFNEGDSDELPVHAVYLDSYNISKYEVTFEQFDIFCDETGRGRPDDEGWGRENRPVINVSWEDAKDFCDWLSEKTGKNIHFPTEAQWEKAARGTDQRRYPWGNSVPNCSTVNYDNCIGRTQPVGSYPSGISAYGIYDMAGNITEYCQDWYLPDYYSISAYTNPTGPDSAVLRVYRGGSWNVTALSVRAVSRYYNNPSNRSKYWGFRLAMD